MKRHFPILIILSFYSYAFRAQDELHFRDSSVVEVIVKEVNPTEVKYILFSYPTGPLRVIEKSSIARIKYKNGFQDIFESPVTNNYFEKYEPPKPYNYDSLRMQGNSLRIYFTDLLVNKITVGYEMMLNKKYSVDIDAFYKFPFDRINVSTTWKDILYHRSEGAEIKAGISRHFYFKETRLSVGLALSYRQQVFHNQNLYSSTYDNYPETGQYNLSQSKRGVGGFLKINFQPIRKYSGIEFFIMPGIYGTVTENKYSSYSNNNSGQPYFYTTNPDEIPKLTTNYMKDGFAFIPNVNFGISLVIKKQPKGWYKKITEKREKLKYKRKNSILYNPVELLDGGIGFTYARILYKQGLSIFAYGAYSNPNNSCPFSDGILLEHNQNYSLEHKNSDLSLQVNYNFSIRQQSFPFVGISGRAAQFEGYYYNYGNNYTFTLNKYYAYVNGGYFTRAPGGFTFLANMSLGHYYDKFAKNDISHLLKQNNVLPRNPTLNSFNFSLQIGYSF